MTVTTLNLTYQCPACQCSSVSLSEANAQWSAGPPLWENETEQFSVYFNIVKAHLQTVK